MLQLLIVNDDLHYCKSLTDTLIHAGYSVDCVCDASSVLSYQKDSPADLIIIEMPLTDPEVLTLISAISEHFATPTILSSPLTEQQILLDALQAGADQYLLKPYAKETLLMCINVLLRRVALEKQRLAIQNCSQEFSLKISRLPLTETEMLLIQYLSKNGGDVVSKATLQKQVLKKDISIFDRNLDMHISNIRKKLLQAGLSKLHIKTVHGQGYCFSERIA